MDQKPTIGRIVHYNAPENDENPGQLLAALITGVNPETGLVSLVMFGQNGFGFRHDVEQGDEKSQWNWPVRS